MRSSSRSTSYTTKSEYIVVFGADHVYRMDPSQMVQAHIASGAGVTVADPSAALGSIRLRLH